MTANTPTRWDLKRWNHDALSLVVERVDDRRGYVIQIDGIPLTTEGRAIILGWKRQLVDLVAKIDQPRHHRAYDPTPVKSREPRRPDPRRHTTKATRMADSTHP